MQCILKVPMLKHEYSMCHCFVKLYLKNKIIFYLYNNIDR